MREYAKTIYIWYPDVNSETVSNWFLKKKLNGVMFTSGVTGLAKVFKEEAIKEDWDSDTYFVSSVGAGTGDSQSTLIVYAKPIIPEGNTRPLVVERPSKITNR